VFCDACRIDMSTKASTLKKHIQSRMHHEAVLSVTTHIAAREKVLEDIKARTSELARQPAEIRAYRVRVMKAWLQQSIPLAKLSGALRTIIEEGGWRLADRKELASLIPAMLEMEIDDLKSQLKGKDVSITFDGTTHTAEAFGVVVRFISGNFILRQKLVSLSLLANPLTGDQTAAQIVSVTLTRLGLSSNRVIGFMRDAVSLNDKARETLLAVFPLSVDLKCCCHLLSRVGERFMCPLLDRWVALWNGVFAFSMKSKNKWMALTGRKPLTTSATRWWSEWEVVNQIGEHWHLVGDFLRDLDTSPKHTSALRGDNSYSSRFISF
jgi:hypothetical protein